MLAADGRLFVVTDKGTVYCFGDKPDHGEKLDAPEGDSPIFVGRKSGQSPAVGEKLDEAARKAADTMAAAAGGESGFALVLGLRDRRPREDLAESLKGRGLHVVVIDPDREKVDAMRRFQDNIGAYGRSISAIVADPATLPLPPYMARLIVTENLAASGFNGGPASVERVYKALRPLGGVACLPLSAAEEARVKDSMARLKLPGLSLRRDGGLTLLKREGPVPGSADWTHYFADAANTRMSADNLVAGPFAVLWFGGPLTNQMIYPKVLTPSTPPIVDGRMFIQGPGAIRAVDIYTGAILWTHQFADKKEERGVVFAWGDLRVGYKPVYGADRDYAKIKRVGYNCVAAADGVYFACGQECLRLNPATGETRSRLTLAGDDGRKLYWDGLRICDDVLVATAISPDVPIPLAGFSRDELRATRKEFEQKSIGQTLEARMADCLVAVDRKTEKVLWRRRARQAFLGSQEFWHPWGSQAYLDCSVAVGGGKAFCLDMLPDDLLAAMKRRGFQPAGKPQLAALDLRTGKTLWEQPARRFCSLSYSREYDVLVTAEVKCATYTQGFVGGELMARKGADGATLWKLGGVTGPVILHHRTVHANGPAMDLLTGAPALRVHPLSGESIPWSYVRGYGCNTPIGGENMLTFRSSLAGYCDLSGQGGTTTIGGIRAGCTNTLIPAGGILNAPNYSYGCICNFQNNTSLALIPSQDVDAWAWTTLPMITRPVRRLAVNFGAVGDRLAEDGALWLACSGNLWGPVKLGIDARPLRPFHWHPSRVRGAEPRWVAASGLDGLRSLWVELAPREGPPIPYAVSLMFIEPQPIARGDRTFDVALQGKTVAEGLDVIAEAGGVRRAVLQTWSGIPVRQRLEIRFTPQPGAKLPYAALCGMEVRSEATK